MKRNGASSHDDSVLQFTPQPHLKRWPASGGGGGGWLDVNQAAKPPAAHPARRLASVRSRSVMHVDSPPPASPTETADGPWWRLLPRYHWFVFAVAAIAWMADCLDQQLFNLARVMSLTDLNGGAAANPDTVKFWASWAASIFLIGWATGGLIFGMFGDKIGRVRTLTLTILLYSIFTGLSALSVGP